MKVQDAIPGNRKEALKLLKAEYLKQHVVLTIRQSTFTNATTSSPVDDT